VEVLPDAQAESDTLELSVVVPMYNEEPVISLFLDRLRPVLDGLGVEYEVACVDDGSRDKTAAIVLDAVDRWPQLRLLRLLRNAGHQAALSAGFAAARGEYVVTIDADLQDPPETIVEMLDAARSAGADVVYAVRRDRSADSWFKRVTSGMYYRLMRRLAGEQVPHNAGDFRLVSRRVVEAIGRLPEQGRVHRLVIPWFGFPSVEVTFVRDARAAGTTHYPLSKMVALAFDSVAAFSAAPLKIATWAGFVGGVVALLAMAWGLYGWFAGVAVPGWTSILATAGLMGAIQLVCLGLLGEYVSRIFAASQQRPTYLVGYDSLQDRHAPEDH
jgi:polyisoprenyl-phosphate glycosyltransferase